MSFEFTKFWDKERYKNAHLSKVDLPEEAIKWIQEWWKKPKGILFFAGNPGCGKSYLIAALIHDLQERKINNFRYLSEREFYSSMREMIEKGWDYMTEIQRICDAEIFFLDDVGFSQMTDFQKECLGAFIDERSQSLKPTIITSNLYLADMEKTLHPRVISRLRDKHNVIIELNWVDKRQKDIDATDGEVGGAVKSRK